MSIPQTGGERVETRAQLVKYFEDGCKERDAWRIGTEHEKFGYDLAHRAPLPYDGECSVVALLEGLEAEFGWERVLEAGRLVGLVKGGANISLEPGGQIELSGAPVRSIHETCDEVNEHLAEVRTIAERIGAGFIGLGASPDWSAEQVPTMPKGRYRLMRGYMKTVGRYGTDMMHRTCTVQVNLDYGSEADMVRKLRVGLALQPIATALFANSPFFDGRPTGHVSWRSRIWRDLDAARTGMLPFVFEDGFGFEAWTDYALDVPMYFVFRDGQYLDARGQSFRDFLAGRLPALPGEKPRLSDWADHLTTIFPEARLKRFIEMRGADGGPWRRLCALPAYWVGILYNSAALDAAWDLVKSWSAETRQALLLAAGRDGLRGFVDELSLHECAARTLAISHEGLKQRACPGAAGLIPDETHFLDALRDSVAQGQSPADELTQRYDTDWNHDLSHIYDEYSY